MIYGLSDLHLDYTMEKDMAVFGEVWADYQENIFKNWKETVEDGDYVLVPGDISWAMRLDQAAVDLERLDRLPGDKILLKGNHDYWWQSLKKMNDLGFESLHFLQNNSFRVGSYSICGTRGWDPRDRVGFTEEDEVVFRRELLRLEMSLDSAQCQNIIAMLHYPPFGRDKKPNEFGEILAKRGVGHCLYGHLHSQGLSEVVEGVFDGVNYQCISSDYLNFKPKKIGGQDGN